LALANKLISYIIKKEELFMKYVIALGGNALERGSATAEAQMQAVMIAACSIVDVIEAGHQVVISHGNGPQVGRLVVQNEYAKSLTPAMPFDICGAMSQGMIGYQLQQALHNELQRRGLNLPVVTVLSQVVVDARDAAFDKPSKPIGAFYSKDEADKLSKMQGYIMQEDAGRGYRRVVASPEPQHIVELESIRRLAEHGSVVIACGGGGVPVIQGDLGLEGVAAVIDKDLASALLARKLGFDALIILTAVEQVAIHFGKPNQENLSQLSLDKAREYLASGEFAAGSMLPKVQAAIMFVSSGKGDCIIAALEQLGSAITGASGTRIHR
jgi:carbamate kinase